MKQTLERDVKELEVKSIIGGSSMPMRQALMALEKLRGEREMQALFL